MSSREANESSKEPLENSPQNSHLLGGTRQRVPVMWPSEVSRVAADEGCLALLSRAQSKGKTVRHSFIVSSTEAREPGIVNFNRLLKRCCCCRAAGMREKCTKITTGRRTEDWKPTGEKPSIQPAWERQAPGIGRSRARLAVWLDLSILCPQFIRHSHA